MHQTRGGVSVPRQQPQLIVVTFASLIVKPHHHVMESLGGVTTVEGTGVKVSGTITVDGAAQRLQRRDKVSSAFSSHQASMGSVPMSSLGGGTATTAGSNRVWRDRVGVTVEKQPPSRTMDRVKAHGGPHHRPTDNVMHLHHPWDGRHRPSLATTTDGR